MPQVEVIFRYRKRPSAFIACFIETNGLIPEIRFLIKVYSVFNSYLTTKINVIVLLTRKKASRNWFSNIYPSNLLYH